MSIMLKYTGGREPNLAEAAPSEFSFNYYVLLPPTGAPIPVKDHSILRINHCKKKLSKPMPVKDYIILGSHTPGVQV